MTEKKYHILEPWRPLKKDELFKSAPKIWFKEGWTLKVDNSISLNYVRHRDDHDNYKGEQICTVFGLKKEGRKKPLALANMVRGGLIQASSLIENFVPEVINYSAEYFADIAKDIQQFLPYYAEVPTKSIFFQKEMETLRLLCANKERYDNGECDWLDILMLKWDCEDQDKPMISINETLVKDYERRLKNLKRDCESENERLTRRMSIMDQVIETIRDPVIHIGVLVKEYATQLEQGANPRELGPWYQVEELADKLFKS